SSYRAVSSSTSRRPPPAPLSPYTTLFRSVLGLHGGEHRGPQILVAEGTARGTLLLAEPGGLESLVPGAEADRGGLVAGDEALKRSEEHTSELQSRFDLVCRLLLEKKKK